MPCRLCLKDVPLRASHIVPKWAWKKARSEGHENPNVVNVHGGVAVQTSAQITEKLLCDECEQRLGRHDGYVGALVYAQDGMAPIFGGLNHLFCLGRNSDATTYRYLLLDGLDA